MRSQSKVRAADGGERRRTLQTHGKRNHGGEEQQDMWCVTGA